MLKVKFFSSVLVSLGLAAGVGYFFRSFIIKSDFLLLTIAAVFAVFYLAIFLVRVLLVKQWQLALPLIALEIIIIDLFLISRIPIVWLISATALAIAILFIAHWRGVSEINNVLKIHFRNLQYMVLSTAILGLTLFGIVIYLSSIKTEEIYVGKKPISYVVKLLPNFSTKISLGININPEENIIDTTQKIVNGLLSKVPNQFRIFIIIGLGILIFFVINGGTFLFVWIIGLIAWLIYKLLLTTNFAHISLEKSQKETVSIE